MLPVVDPTEAWVLLPALVLLFVFTIFFYLIYSGLLSPIEVFTKEPRYNDLVFAYKIGQGPYKEVGALFTETFALMPHRCVFPVCCQQLV